MQDSCTRFSRRSGDLRAVAAVIGGRSRTRSRTPHRQSSSRIQTLRKLTGLPWSWSISGSFGSCGEYDGSPM